jgi:hypothetical protein
MIMTPAEIRELAKTLAVNLAAAAETRNQFVYNATLAGVEQVLLEQLPDEQTVEQ